MSVMRQSFPKCMFSDRQRRQTVWWESLGGRERPGRDWLSASPPPLLVVVPFMMSYWPHLPAHCGISVEVGILAFRAWKRSCIFLSLECFLKMEMLMELRNTWKEICEHTEIHSADADENRWTVSSFLRLTDCCLHVPTRLEYFSHGLSDHNSGKH